MAKFLRNFKLFIAYLFIIGAFAFGITSVQASSPSAATAVIDNLTEQLDLAPYVEYLEDTDRAISIEDIKQAKVNSRWQQNGDKVFTSKNSSARYWFRVNIHNNTSEHSAFVLYLPHQPTYLYQLELWMLNDSEVVKNFSTGSLRPYLQRDIASQFFVFHTPAALEEYSIVGWVDNLATGMPMMLPFKLLTTLQWQKQHEENLVLLTAFYAVMMALLIYNGSLLINLKQAIYGYYVLFLFAAMSFCAFADGSISHWLIPNDPSNYLKLTFIAGISLLLCYLLFMREALGGLLFSHRIRILFSTLFWFGLVYFL